MFRILAHRPYGSFWLNMSVTNITTSGWVQISASLPGSCSALEVFNPSASLLQISTGKSGQESSNIIPYTILPGGSSILLPIELKVGSRLSAQAVDQTASSGYLTFNVFG